jgi:hypothetical protein
MKEPEKEETNFKNEKAPKNRNYKCSAGGNGIYGLGFIGSAVFFIGHASSFGEGVLGFLKALVWPAFMTYEVFKYLIK